MKNIIITSLLAFFVPFAVACSLHKTDKPLATTSVPPLSVQLWSVKHAVKADFKGTLQKIADMGFKGVELAGDYGEFANDPAGLKAYLNSLGLTISGAHMGLKQLRGDKLQKNIAFAKAAGIPMIIVPGDKRAAIGEEINSLTQELTELTNILAKEGIAFGYHNHAKEFAAFNNSTYWDYIAQNTPKNMLLQLDVGWVNYAGVDPIDYLKRYPNRTLATHYKIRTKEGEKTSVILGQNNYDWSALLKATMQYGGTQWIVIEQEEYPEDTSPLEAVAASKQGLDNIIAKLNSK